MLSICALDLYIYICTDFDDMTAVDINNAGCIFKLLVEFLNSVRVCDTQHLEC